MNLNPNEIMWEDMELFKKLYALDDKPSGIFSCVAGAQNSDPEGWPVAVTLLDEELEFWVQLSGGQFLSQMGCQICSDLEGDYWADPEEEIIGLFMSEITLSAEKACAEYTENLLITDEDGVPAAWEVIERGTVYQTATSEKSYVIQERVEAGSKTYKYKYRVIADNSGFIQPNDYASLYDVEPVYVDSLESARDAMKGIESE